MRNNYQNQSIKELCLQQSNFSTREKKLQQLAQAEALLADLDPQREYTYEYLCYRITGYRPSTELGKLIPGEVARHDILLFVENLSDAADIRADECGETIYTMNELSKKLGVSTKTLNRWREQGLVSRRFLVKGRKRVVFLQSSVDQFVELNQDRVKRGQGFSQLSDEDKGEIVDRARRLAQAGGCPSEVAKRIASHMGRSSETIRYTIKNYDADNPGSAIFPNQTGPLSQNDKEKIYAQFRRNTSVERLARQYCRSVNSIYRVINEMRAIQLLNLPLDYIDSEEFHQSPDEKVILGPLPVAETPPRKTKAPSDLTPYLASLYDTPLLSREQEQHLFRRFNYLKFKADQLRKELDPPKATVAAMEKIEELYNQAVETKNQIVEANLRLVVSIAKRHVSGNDEFFELVSDGNMSLIRACEKFDYSRGNKFSTYASWAIMKNFARSIPEGYKHRDRYRTSGEEMLAGAEDQRSDQYLQESAQNQRKQQILKILGELDEREQKIIISRFGLDHSHEPLTLKEVGKEMGVTKERVRQIEARALLKLRAAAKEANIELPEL